MAFTGTLRPFQEQCVIDACRRKALLIAMHMGLGKTVATIAAIEDLHDMEEVDRCLVILPKTLKHQWAREIRRFSDAEVIIIDGDKDQRRALYRRSRNVLNVRYTLVNYETVVSDFRLLNQMRWDAVVIDEITAIKGFRTKRSRFIKKLGANIPIRFGLSGQPIENRPEELFSIMEFIDPEVLGRFDVFDNTFIRRDAYGRPIRYKNLATLHARISEAMFRRTRNDVKDQLPDVEETLIPVEFDEAGAALYRKISQDLLQEIENALSFGSFDVFSHYGHGDSDEYSARGRIMSRLLALRMLCDHPDLIPTSGANYNDPDVKKGSEYAALLVEWGLPAVGSPKFATACTLLDELLAEGHKVVLFSFFKDVLFAFKRKYKTAALYHGEMDEASRDASVQRFMNSSQCNLFLSSDAGGYGVNLQSASYLISYDLPWSAGKLAQRNARIIRMFSEHELVNIISLVMKGSIEERQYAALKEKQGISDAIVDGKFDKDGKFSLNLQTLSDFVRNSSV